MPRQSNYVHINFKRIKKETNNAFLVKIIKEDDDTEEIWLPKSQIADSDDYKEGDKNGTMSITEWIAKQKGLDDESE